MVGKKKYLSPEIIAMSLSYQNVIMASGILTLTGFNTNDQDNLLDLSGGGGL